MISAGCASHLNLSKENTSIDEDGHVFLKLGIKEYNELGEMGTDYVKNLKDLLKFWKIYQHPDRKEK